MRDCPTRGKGWRSSGSADRDRVEIALLVFGQRKPGVDPRPFAAAGRTPGALCQQRDGLQRRGKTPPQARRRPERLSIHLSPCPRQLPHGESEINYR